MKDAASDRVRSFIKEHHMLKTGDTVCVGLSGGADSVCLLLLLDDLSDELGIRITAFHVNHTLRGEESDADEDYAAGLCGSRKIPLKRFRFDVAAAAAESRTGLEEAGRILRRRAALEAAASFGADRIALAHHANDNAETVLFNMVRGSSAGGLKGILPVNGKWIRPLLCLERSEIEAELKKRGVAWREDSTNASTDYSRNLIRNVVLPALSDRVNDAAVRHINEAASDMAEAFEMIEEAAGERLARYSVRTKEGLLLRNGILTGKRLTDGRIALRAMAAVSGQAADLTRIHARDLRTLFEKQTGRAIALPYGMTAERGYEGVLIRKKTDAKEEEQLPEMPLPEGGEAEYGGLTIRTEIINITEIPDKIPENRYTKWFDYDRISGCGIIRRGLPEDHIVIDSEGGRKKLKKYFTDEKIPREQRRKAVCLAAGSEILWVIGFRMGESAKVTKDTKRVLKVEIREKCNE